MDEALAAIEDVASVRKAVRLDESSDPNELLGRRDGYDHAAVFYDVRRRCLAPGIECGAFLEVWDTAEEARARAEYLKAVQRGMPMLGTEYRYRRDHMLLRVSGELPRRVAKQYQSALMG